MTGFVLIGKHIKEFNVLILTLIINIEFIQTNKKSELLVFEGYGYIRHRQLTVGASSWRCCITKCNSRVRLRNEEIEVITVHSHLTNPADTEKQKFRSALTDRAAMTDETPRQTKLAAQKEINRETAANIPAYNSNQRTFNRTRPQVRPQMNEPSTLKEFEIPDLLKMVRTCGDMCSQLAKHRNTKITWSSESISRWCFARLSSERCHYCIWKITVSLPRGLWANFQLLWRR